MLRSSPNNNTWFSCKILGANQHSSTAQALEVVMATSREPTPSDRQGFARRWFAKNLQRVFTPTTAAEVVGAWQEIVRRGEGGPGSTQITCGRHCYEDFVYRDETQSIIDMTGLKGYGDDPTYGLYIDVGYGNWDMYRIFNNVFDRTVPAGSCYSVGLGGHITGGGYGLLSRQFGLTIDHLTAVDIVVKTGPMPELVTASASENPDLFWALRGGGGGNFGIITRYYFGDLPQSPLAFYSNAATIEWKAADDKTLSAQTFADLLSLYSESNVEAQGAPVPSFDIFHLNHEAAGSIVWAMYRFDVAGSDLSPDERSEAAAQAFDEKFDRIREITPVSVKPGPINGHPWHGSAGPIMPADAAASFRQYTFLEGMQNTNGSGPNRFGKYKSAYMNKAFTNDMAAALYQGLTTTPGGMDMSQSLCQVDSYGCAINQLDSAATAIPQRDSIMKLQYQTYWDNDSVIGGGDPAQSKAHVDWVNTMYADVYADYGQFPDPRLDPDGTVDGCYFNYCDSDLGTNDDAVPGIDHAMYLYFKDNYKVNPRNLLSVKRNWNPENWFSSAQSIPV